MLDKDRPTRFALIRHAPTMWNRQKLIQGQKDSPLTKEGRTLSRTWGRVLQDLHFDRILTSDLGRSVSTARLINQTLGLGLEKTDQLRELDWGQWTGKRIQDIRSENPRKLEIMEGKGWQFCPPGGESYMQVWHRARDVLRREANRFPGDSILTVTHEGLIKCMVYRLSERQLQPQNRVPIKPYHLHWLSCQKNEVQIDTINALALC